MANATKHKVTDGDKVLQKIRADQKETEQQKFDRINAERREMLENNPAYQDKLKALRGLIREGAQKVDLNFPAYWKAETASGFRGVLLKREDRDVGSDGEVFIRYHWRNTGPAPLECRRGKAADGIVEDVPVGGIFTTSHFGKLPLHKWYGFEVTVICLDKQKLPGNEKSDWEEREMWEFEGHLLPEDIARIESNETEDMLFVIEAQKQADRAAVLEMARINSAERLGIADQLQKRAEERAKAA